MENVHILAQRTPTRGDYVPFATEQYVSQAPEQPNVLVEKLQTTLEVNGILDIFASYVKRITDLAGLQFHSNQGLFQTQQGDNQLKPYTFDLDLDGQHLGQLVYFSKYSLSGTIRARLMQLHACLLYPLRNALMYHRVLQLATKDTLTGLYNRSQFNEYLDTKLERSRRQHRNFSLMLLDLDNFKQVNDEYGHKKGDEVLIGFANILTSSIRATDAVFRFGGDEFAILIDDPAFTTNKVIAERIMQRVNNNSLLAKHQVTTSIGFTLASSQDCSNEIFARADSGLYKAKQAGRNCARAV
ncbi:MULTISPECIES: GGDEF domain-containing protein [Pseudoalteromonas]|uniref:diguanylate cyclase n=1 Tax=Pseudoalteromonas obscura TaxID=3048491 RepID=A0ABT7ETI1_9GAMM|nr:MULTISPECIES: GGDEF domain-containing protein [Pseudoalteromonas]MBQ4837086.1 GGDEF domain-containing protein [Pseudoalteromonas luteoviolacea]MDK2598308.1 GGDEF domain-containing protein [Pseudoalteromonas sp. P94(2023)]